MMASLPSHCATLSAAGSRGSATSSGVVWGENVEQLLCFAKRFAFDELISSAKGSAGVAAASAAAEPMGEQWQCAHACNPVCPREHVQMSTRRRGWNGIEGPARAHGPRARWQRMRCMQCNALPACTILRVVCDTGG